MQNKKIVVASSNQGKIKEFKEILEPKGYTVLSLLDLPEKIEIEENGTTFSENAVLKANSVTEKLGIDAIADDSGLEIDALNKEPGIHSARYLGHDTPYDYKNKVILERLENETNRSCRYVCAIALTRKDHKPEIFYDTCECLIADEPRGNNGFGYDPIVYYEPLGKTMAEMSPDEKNEISHRGKAVRKLEKFLSEQTD